MKQLSDLVFPGRLYLRKDQPWLIALVAFTFAITFAEVRERFPVVLLQFPEHTANIISNS